MSPSGSAIVGFLAASPQQQVSDSRLRPLRSFPLRGGWKNDQFGRQGSLPRRRDRRSPRVHRPEAAGSMKTAWRNRSKRSRTVSERCRATFLRNSSIDSNSSIRPLVEKRTRASCSRSYSAVSMLLGTTGVLEKYNITGLSALATRSTLLHGSRVRLCSWCPEPCPEDADEHVCVVDELAVDHSLGADAEIRNGVVLPHAW